MRGFQGCFGKVQSGGDVSPILSQLIKVFRFFRQLFSDVFTQKDVLRKTL